MARAFEPKGFSAFVTVWLGQVVSAIGSGLSGFALGVWTFQSSGGSVTQFALIVFFGSVPGILMSPIAGALVDRWDRRWAMILSDTGAGLCTLVLALLLWADRLEIWHVYLLGAISAAMTAFQWPAFSAATTLLVPKRHLGRASGMLQAAMALAQVLAPGMAGALVATIGPAKVLLIDFATFLFALLTLLVVRFPRPEATLEGTAKRGSLLGEAWWGWQFIRDRPGLLGILMLFASTNFCMAMLQVLVTPLVLGFTTTEVLGVVLSVAGAGMLAGSIVMGVWGGPRRKVYGLYVPLAIQGLILLLGGLRPSALLIASAAFVFLFVGPILLGSSQAIWQIKVPPDLQGRVFAVRRMVAWSTLPLASLLAGPLADRIFEPMMAPGGLLAGSVGRVLGVGEGRGIGLLFMVLGILVLLVVSIAYRSPRLRNVETELPDVVDDEPAAALAEEAPATTAG
ncbi:MAG TPA: MFS transporter [Thermoanaerobaculia bacterium]|nr:MFS transporter [Thermoanaerobaculia bacterium]